MDQTTRLLRAWADGDRMALDQLMPILEGELRQLARRVMSHERPDQTLQPTALVNEAFLRLIDLTQVQWRDRAHFLAMAARTMRRVLVDAARARRSLKRGAGVATVLVEDVSAPGAEAPRDVIALHDALNALASFDARKSQVVELRFFGGLTVEETAAVLGISMETVMRDWKFARAWLLKELSADGSN